MKLVFETMIRILFIIYSWASLSSACSLHEGYRLLRKTSESDDAFANVISETNWYIKDQNLNVHKLTNFLLNLPLVSLNFYNGQMRDFSTIELHKSSILPQGGGSGKIYWTVGVGLGLFSLQYDLKSDFFDIFENSGTLRMTVSKTNILLSGTIDVFSPKCSTILEIVTFMDFPDVDIEVQPFSIKNFFFKHLLRFVVNHSKILLIPKLNSYLKEFIVDLVPPSKLNEILCKYLKQFSRE